MSIVVFEDNLTQRSIAVNPSIFFPPTDTVICDGSWTGTIDSSTRTINAVNIGTQIVIENGSLLVAEQFNVPATVTIDYFISISGIPILQDSIFQVVSAVPLFAILTDSISLSITGKDIAGANIVFNGTASIGANLTYSIPIPNNIIIINTIKISFNLGTNLDRVQNFSRIQIVSPAPIQQPLNLYSVLAGVSIENTGNTIIQRGNIGVFPGNTITGFPPGQVLDGSIDPSTFRTEIAQNQLSNAINTLRNQPITQFPLSPNLGNGQVLVPGVYSFTGNDVTISGTLSLPNPSGFYIFKIDGSLTINNNASIVSSPTNCNIYFIVGTNVSIDSSSQFQGNILAQGNITLGSSTITLNGRLLSKGAVRLNNNRLVGSCIPSDGGTGGGGGIGVRRLLCDPIGDDCICHKHRTKKCTKCRRKHICKFCGCDPRNKYDDNNDYVNRNVVATVNTNNGSGNCRTCGQR